MMSTIFVGQKIAYGAHKTCESKRWLHASQSWTLRDSYAFISTFVANHSSTARCDNEYAQHPYILSFNRGIHSYSRRPRLVIVDANSENHVSQRHSHSRKFHDYFVTNLPSSSVHPDARSPVGPHHKLPRAASTPHTPASGSSSSAAPVAIGIHREMTVVRIPLRSAKHHFGVSVSRGQRPYNEDAHQAGVIEMPAFAKKSPISLTRSRKDTASNETQGAESASGDPQVFYFGVFDGHGGAECSAYLREELHGYIERSAIAFDMKSTVKMPESNIAPQISSAVNPPAGNKKESSVESTVDSVMNLAEKSFKLQKDLYMNWKETVGGYYKRFKPDFFLEDAGGAGRTLEREASSKSSTSLSLRSTEGLDGDAVSIATILSYAFLKADFDFITLAAEQKKRERQDDMSMSEKPLNEDDVLHNPNLGLSKRAEKGKRKYKGGSTCSVAVISTPTPTPFWHPATPSTLVTSHVGDTRILLCSTATGEAVPLTTNHHPSSPVEARRLRRYAATFVTDSFGEERMSGLANTRSFGDMQSKRVGVSAEPEIRLFDLAPAQYSFLVMMSDGVSGTLSDQEVVDIVKEAKTPEQGARDIVSFATTVSADGDNATCICVRLGGWERRGEGGLGSMGTKEMRDFRKQSAEDPRSRMF